MKIKNNSNIKVSIITPVYNSINCLPDLLKSISGQLCKQVEWIIVDDGSIDGSYDFLEKKVKGINNIKLIHSENSGAGKARNLGINHALGKWIVFLDSDDLLMQGAVNKILSFIVNIKNVDLIYTPRASSDMLGTSIKIDYPERTIKNYIPQLEFFTTIYNKEFLDKNNIRFYEFRAQDIETAFRYLAYSQTNNIIISNDLLFYIKRDNPRSNTHTWNTENLYYIKTLVYFDLFKNHCVRPANNFLLKVVLDCAIRYKICIHKTKNKNITRINNINQIVKSIHKTKLSLYNFLLINLYFILGDK